MPLPETANSEVTGAAPVPDNMRTAAIVELMEREQSVLFLLHTPERLANPIENLSKEVAERIFSVPLLGDSAVGFAIGAALSGYTVIVDCGAAPPPTHHYHTCLESYSNAGASLPIVFCCDTADVYQSGENSRVFKIITPDPGGCLPTALSDAFAQNSPTVVVFPELSEKDLLDATR